MWVYDEKTGVIQNWKHRGWVLSIQAGRNNQRARVVVRPRQNNSPQQQWVYKSNQYSNWTPFSNNGLCIDAAQGDREGSYIHLWTHHRGWNQRWEINYKTQRPVYKSTGMPPNKPFMIKSRMRDGRVLYYANKIAGNQYQISIRKPQYTEHELWFFDPKSGHVRNFVHKNWAIGVQNNNRGARLVLQIAKWSPSQKWNHQPNRYHNWSNF